MSTRALQEVIPLKLRTRDMPKPSTATQRHWITARRNAYLQRYGKVLPTNQPCVDCGEPLSEAMCLCPWCGSERNRFDSTTHYRYTCRRCTRGMLPEWSYCPWCYGPGYEPIQTKATTGLRAHGTCRRCHGKLWRFMRYCPTCKSKVPPWSVPVFPETCTQCKGPVDHEFWHYCPWCAGGLW